MHQLMAGDAGYRCGRNSTIQSDSRAQRIQSTPALADDHLALAQRLDRPKDGGRQTRLKDFGARTRCRGRDAHKPEHLKILEQWMKSYGRRNFLTRTAVLMPELAEFAPEGARTHGRQPACQRRDLLRGSEDAGLPRLSR